MFLPDMLIFFSYPGDIKFSFLSELWCGGKAPEERFFLELWDLIFVIYAHLLSIAIKLEKCGDLAPCLSLSVIRSNTPRQLLHRFR